MAGPFDGVRIIDLSSVLMGPLATQMFADLGADVIKVEPPQGDILRGIGPGRHDDMRALYLTLNRNKRSIVLDMKTPQGKEAVLRLIRDADVLFFNIRPQAMARLGLDYEAVRAANEKIIYCGVYGFAQDGPFAAKPAYDDLIQGAVGLPWLSEKLTGKASYVPFSIADHLVGMYAAFCLSAALHHRQKTGEGQRVEVPMYETMAQTVMTHHMFGKTFVPPLGQAGYTRQLAPARKPYRTLDGYICTLIVSDRQWHGLFEMIGRPELKTDPRFADIGNRTVHTDALYALLEENFPLRSTAEWLDLFGKSDIPAMPLQSLDELLDDPHLQATGFFRTVDHPSEGRLRAMKVPANWGASATDEFRAPAPRLGEHSEEILKEAGYSETDIRALMASGTSAKPTP